MNRNKNLIKNTFIIAVGSFGSKILQFLLLPFYTYVLTDAQYGTVDNIQSIGTLLIPLVSLTIFDGVFRFAMDKSSDQSDAFTIGLRISTYGSLILIALGVILVTLNIYPEYVLLVVAYTITYIFRTVASNFVRAIGNIKLFAIDNTIQTLLFIGFNIVFLVVFNFGITGYMLGYILGNLISFLNLFIFGKLWKYFKKSGINKNTTKAMLRFSIPLIPSTICWWITSTIGRLMVTSSLGAEANGVYAVANKIPTILTVIMQVFLQAWEVTANDEYESNSKDFADYNSNILKTFESIIFFASAMIILFCKPIASILGSGFQSAWEYIPIMLVGTAYFTFGQFYGVLYITSKQTVMAFITNLVTALISIGLNILLIPRMGVMGAAVSQGISYFIFWITRMIDTRRITKLKSNILTIPNNILLLALALVVTYSKSHWLVISLGLTAVITVINFKPLLEVLKNVLSMLHFKRKTNEQ